MASPRLDSISQNLMFLFLIAGKPQIRARTYCYNTSYRETHVSDY
jgi:hypothetical protein